MTNQIDSTTPQNPSKRYGALVVPKALTKTIKDALDNCGRFDKRLKIKPVSTDLKWNLIDGDLDHVREGSSIVPLSDTNDGPESLSDLISLIEMGIYKTEISLIDIFVSDNAQDQRLKPRMNLLARTVQQWLQDHTDLAHARFGHNASELRDALQSCSWTYMIYPPLLLFPPSFPATLYSFLGDDTSVEHLSSLYLLIRENFGVDHIAVNAPIAKNVDIVSWFTNSPKSDKPLGSNNTIQASLLRSPTGLAPLSGDFGPDLPIDHAPTSDDFASAFWCTARQNNIFQTWAPRYVMFSRGNISEKTRLLTLPSLCRKELQIPPQEISAVDLYAGIGYFAFSYARTHVGRILCWEINPWSVEGLRRGTKENGWTSRVVQRDESHTPPCEEDERFTIFQESNEHAAARINAIRDNIPPIKHVNCGYLPTSRNSWDAAVQALDPTGGWIHAHENVAKKDIETRKVQIIRIFSEITRANCHKSLRDRLEVDCDHVERVKSYAPGIIHCVFDITLKLVD